MFRWQILWFVIYTKGDEKENALSWKKAGKELYEEDLNMLRTHIVQCALYINLVIQPYQSYRSWAHAEGVRTLLGELQTHSVKVNMETTLKKGKRSKTWRGFPS